VRHLAIRTLLRLAGGIEGDPAVRDYSALVAAHERHRAELLGQPVHTHLAGSAAALLHAIARLRPLEARNDIFAWLAACALLGLSNITVKATPQQALALVRSAQNGELDEAAIAARLAAFSTDDPLSPAGPGQAAGRPSSGSPSHAS
jgi:prophage maintenance system killer protein